jgi:hypothetical protein
VSLLSLSECLEKSSLDIKDSKYTTPEVWVRIVRSNCQP